MLGVSLFGGININPPAPPQPWEDWINDSFVLLRDLLVYHLKVPLVSVLVCGVSIYVAIRLVRLLKKSFSLPRGK